MPKVKSKSNKLTFRKLKADEVTFTVTVEQENIPVRGNCMASGDDAFDRECEDEIIQALDRGDIEAWCYILVTAEWEGSKGHGSLGGCSFMSGTHQPVQAQITETIDEHGLREQALDSLNASVERQALRCLDIIEKLKVVLPKARKR